MDAFKIDFIHYRMSQALIRDKNMNMRKRATLRSMFEKMAENEYKKLIISMQICGHPICLECDCAKIECAVCGEIIYRCNMHETDICENCA